MFIKHYFRVREPGRYSKKKKVSITSNSIYEAMNKLRAEYGEKTNISYLYSEDQSLINFQN